MNLISAEEFIKGFSDKKSDCIDAFNQDSRYISNPDVTSAYILNDIATTQEAILMRDPFAINKVIFNYPATIVLWEDGTKTVVKCAKDEPYDPEKGLSMCISKKALGRLVYKPTFKKWVDPELLKIKVLAIPVDTNSKAMDKLMDAIERGYVPDD